MKVLARILVSLALALAVSVAAADATKPRTARPDLAIVAMSKPVRDTRDITGLKLVDVAKNLGRRPAPASTTRYYLSVDRKRSDEDILIRGERRIPRLDPGESSRGVAILTTPPIAAPIAHFVLSCADEFHVVAEADEDNNCRASKARI